MKIDNCVIRNIAVSKLIRQQVIQMRGEGTSMIRGRGVPNRDQQSLHDYPRSIVHVAVRRMGPQGWEHLSRYT
jgi:hypothetical protein